MNTKVREKQEIVKIRCFDTCTYNLLWPEWFYSATPKSTMQILHWMFQFSWMNEEAISFLQTNMLSLETEAVKRLENELSKNSDEKRSKMAYCENAEEKKYVSNYYNGIARKIKKYPENARKVMDYFMRVNL